MAMKVGDLVKIVHNVLDSHMPLSRTGMLIDFVGKENDQVLIMFDNLKTLKFHITQVAKIVSKS